MEYSNHKLHAELLTKFIVVIVVILFIAGFLKLANNAMNKDEVIQCDTLVAQSHDFTNGAFFVTQEEHDMCASHRISINAPIYSSMDCVNGVSDTVPRCQLTEEQFNNFNK